VISMCDDRHRHQEWLKFLRVIDQVTPPDKELHLIVDNYATHKHPKVQRWLARHPRFHVHFTPTSSSWLNMVERFFRDLTQNRLRRGVFHDAEELIMAIGEFIDKHNQSPKPFIWTKKAFDILEKVKRARRTHTTSWPKCRPLNSSSTATNRGICPSLPSATAFAPEPPTLDARRLRTPRGACSPLVAASYHSHVSITLELTEVELEVVLKALRNEADRDRAYHRMGLSDILSNIVNQIEAQVVATKKPAQRETEPGKREKRASGREI